MVEVQQMFHGYTDLRTLVNRYWSAYGRFRAFLFSPYLHLSVGILFVTYGVWTRDSWWSFVISIVPNMLGFSLGALAIILGFGNDRFLTTISGQRPGEPGESPYV